MPDRDRLHSDYVRELTLAINHLQNARAATQQLIEVVEQQLAEYRATVENK